MTSEKICSYNKYGHCKYKNTCRFRHVDTICELEICDVTTCESRHPKTCNFYHHYNRCKFSPCSYKHVDRVPQAFNIKLEELKDTLKLREMEIIELRNIIQATNEHVKALESKSNNLEMKIRDMEDIKTKSDCCFKPVNDEISLNEDPTCSSSPPSTDKSTRQENQSSSYSDKAPSSLVEAMEILLEKRNRDFSQSLSSGLSSEISSAVSSKLKESISTWSSRPPF